MRKTLSLTLAAALAACGGSGAFKDQAREAMPSSSTLQTGSPQASHNARQHGDQTQQDSTVGAHSDWFNATVGVSAIFNGSTAWVLGIIEAVTNSEPTSCTSTSCTWGPGSGALEANNFKLVVTKDSGDFKYALSGEPKSKAGSGFVIFISGSATPSAQPHHGAGSFTIDFDQAAKLDNPHADTGKLTVHYTNVGPANIEVAFPGAKDDNHPTQKNNLVYTYKNDATGGGDMDVAIHNTTTDDRFSIHSRWKGDGQGRADVSVRTTTNGSAQLSECWGIAPFNTVYFASTASAYLGPNQGLESSCAYSPAQPSTQQAP